jgi:hypothetical protein
MQALDNLRRICNADQQQSDNDLNQFKKEKSFTISGSIRTLPPINFAVPMRDEISSLAKELGLKAWSYPFCYDLIHIGAGGTYVSKEIWLEKLFKEAEQYEDRNEEASFLKSATEYHENVINFLQSIDFKSLPGSNPLQKAIALLVTLSKTAGGTPTGKGGSNSALPIFVESNVSTVPIRIYDEISALDGSDLELLLADEQNLASSSEYSERDLQEINLASCVLSSEIKTKIIEVARVLEENVNLRIIGVTSKSAKKQASVPLRRQMLSLDELGKVTPDALAIKQASPDLFWLKAVERDLSIRTRRSEDSLDPEIARKQLLYMLLDATGSMKVDPSGRYYSHIKSTLARAVLHNRLKGVLEGEAELFFRFFDTNIYTEHRATNSMQAKKLLKTVATCSYSGGDTKIDYCIRQTVKAIKKHMDKGVFITPHLALVTDGVDTVNLSINDLEDTTLHVFFCGGYNQKLAAVAKESGGSVVKLLED